MERQIYINTFDLNRNKLCSLYDSGVSLEGAAYDITVQKEASGYSELQFKLPSNYDGKRNFRLSKIKNEQLICVEIDEIKEWYIIKEIKEQVSKRKDEVAFTCPHLSSQLKSKNLYLEFDGDTNGIGTAEQLVEQVIEGTGWTLVKNENSKIYEKDGTTEKVRTYKNNGKAGSYQMIEDLGELFGFYPKYISDTKQVELIPMKTKGKSLEISLSKNIGSLSRTPDTTNIVTRLYVEGEYTDDGYVGIDDVNPTGLSFLTNFDYYKSIGLFTEQHQKALDQYLADILAAKKKIKSIRKNIEDSRTRLSELWGGMSFVFWEVDNGELKNPLLESKATEEDTKKFPKGAKAMIIDSKNNYRFFEYVEENKHPEFTVNDKFMLIYLDLPSGLIGANEVNRDAKKATVKMYQDDLMKNSANYSQNKINEINDQIATENSAIQELEIKVKTLYKEAIQLYLGLYKGESLFKQYDNAQEEHQNIENIFVEAMGEMLIDGFYNDPNYVEGQEENLYKDSLEILANTSMPEIKYNISIENLASVKGYEQEEFELFDQLYLYDKELEIEDTVWIDEITDCIDNPISTNISISNSTMRKNGRNLTSSLSNIGRLSENVKAKGDVYERAKNITSDGKFSASKIQGMIDLTASRITSSGGGWYTDAGGNIVFESSKGNSAMMLSGEGFLLANGKTPDGKWNWRTFGTGTGFRADEINTGFLSSKLIETKSITLDKLSNDVGTSIDLTTNQSITAMVKKEEMQTALVQTKQMFSNEIREKIKEITNVNGEMVETTKQLLAYQRFTKYGLEIGRSDSDFVIRITPQRISFLDKGMEIAYFANNRLNVKELSTGGVSAREDGDSFVLSNSMTKAKKLELKGEWELDERFIKETVGRKKFNTQQSKWIVDKSPYVLNTEYKLAEKIFDYEVYEQGIAVDNSMWNDTEEAYLINTNLLQMIQGTFVVGNEGQRRLVKSNIYVKDEKIYIETDKQADGIKLRLIIKYIK